MKEEEKETSGNEIEREQKGQKEDARQGNNGGKRKHDN